MRGHKLPAGVLTLFHILGGSEQVLAESVSLTGKAPDFIRAAAMFYLEQVLWIGGPEPYRDLGVPRDAPQEQLVTHLQAAMEWLRPYMGGGQRESVLAERILMAWFALSTPERRVVYDQEFLAPQPVIELPADRRPAGGAIAAMVFLGLLALGIELSGVDQFRASERHPRFVAPPAADLAPPTQAPAPLAEVGQVQENAEAVERVTLHSAANGLSKPNPGIGSRPTAQPSRFPPVGKLNAAVARRVETSIISLPAGVMPFEDEPREAMAAGPPLPIVDSGPAFLPAAPDASNKQQSPPSLSKTENAQAPDAIGAEATLGAPQPFAIMERPEVEGGLATAAAEPMLPLIDPKPDFPPDDPDASNQQQSPPSPSSIENAQAPDASGAEATLGAPQLLAIMESPEEGGEATAAEPPMALIDIDRPLPPGDPDPPVADRAATSVERGFSPSFDCRKAKTASERAICADPALSEKDRTVTQLYKRLRRALGKEPRAAAKELQRTWLRKREQCGDSRSCVNRTYDARIRELRTALGGVS